MYSVIPGSPHEWSHEGTCFVKQCTSSVQAELYTVYLEVTGNTITSIIFTCPNFQLPSKAILQIIRPGNALEHTHQEHSMVLISICFEHLCPVEVFTPR